MVATIRKTISGSNGGDEVKKKPNKVTTIRKPTVDEKKDDSTAITEASSAPGSGPPLTAVDISKWYGEDIEASMEEIRIKDLQLIRKQHKIRKQNEKTFVEAQKGVQAAEKSVTVGEDNGNKLNYIAEMMEVASEPELNLKKAAEKSARKAQALGASNRRKDNETKKLQTNLAAAMGHANRIKQLINLNPNASNNEILNLLSDLEGSITNAWQASARSH